MATEAPPAIQYRDLMAECQQLMTKVADLESDRNEHILVEDTLKPLDGGRRAYRLVGDVLVERTVTEVLPSITQNKNNVRKTIGFSLENCLPISVLFVVAENSCVMKLGEPVFFEARAFYSQTLDPI